MGKYLIWKTRALYDYDNENINTICDKLSRFQATQQDLCHSGLTREQMEIPSNLLPENFILQ